jgi:hypothetical protein
MSDDRYVMLLAALPHLRLPRTGGTALPFHVDRTAINRIRLDRRLAWIDDADRELLMRIENVLAWERLPLAATDRDLVAAITSLLDDLRARRSPHLHRLVHDRFVLRTLVAALRRRHAGEPAPDRAEVFGEPDICARTRRRWHAPAFGLGAVHTWLPAAERLLRDDDSVGFERLVITESWRQLERTGFGHTFDFVAVVVWLLKWGLIDRCVRHDEQAAARRFDRLLDAARGPRALETR